VVTNGARATDNTLTPHATGIQPIPLCHWCAFGALGAFGIGSRDEEKIFFPSGQARPLLSRDRKKYRVARQLFTIDRLIQHARRQQITARGGDNFSTGVHTPPVESGDY
jgi:hypothetical protein